MLKLKGKTFNRLTAIDRVGTSKMGLAIWSFKCVCGKHVKGIASEVVRGRKTSCGCARKKPRTHGVGVKSSEFYSEYITWRNMTSRCTDRGHKHYKDYGGRGISICERWNDVLMFIDDMGKRPETYHTIDRIDNDGNYEPSNCRWASREEQASNKRNSKIWIVNNVEYISMKAAAKHYGVNPKTIYRWCEGNKEKGTPARNGCYSLYKYQR